MPPSREVHGARLWAGPGPAESVEEGEVEAEVSRPAAREGGT